MYKLIFHRRADKEIAKLSKGLRKVIRDVHLKIIAESPFQRGLPLKGSLKGYYKYVIKHKRVEYRLVYEVIEKESAVAILMVGKREGFYQRLMKRLHGRSN